MDWNRPLDLYCERLDPGLLAEPLNAASNLSFFLAAWFLFRHVHHREWDFRVLVALLAAIGAGSLAFHTVGTAGMALVDQLAIAVFIWFYLQRLLVRYGRLGNGVATVAIVAYAVGSRLVEKAFPDGAFNGSAGYLPALATLLALTAWVGVDRPDARRPFIAASLVFLVSLTLRTIDQAVCPSFPYGTHFAWHLLNGVVLYCLGRGLAGLTAGRAGSRSAWG